MRAAVDSGHLPLQLLYDDLEKKPTQWDSKLIKALYMMESFEVEGHPIWIEESDRIRFEAKRKKIRSLAAVEAAQETHSKKDHPEKGIRFVAVAKLTSTDAKWPTRAEWIEKQSKKRKGIVEESADQKVIDRDKAAEERARIKMAEMGLTVD